VPNVGITTNEPGEVKPMMMEPQITFRNAPKSDAIENLIRERVAGLDTFYDRIMGCRVTVEVPHRHQREGDHFRVKIDLTVPGGEIVVSREPSLHSSQQETEVERRTKDEEVETSHKHLKVAIREAFEAARRQLQDYARRRRADVKTHRGPQRAIVSRVFVDEGYGYLETLDGREVYFHRNSLLGRDLDDLTVGSEVVFVEEQGDRGPQASTIRAPGKRPRKQSVKASSR
jgi:cold shock CspA family protein